MAAPTGAPVGGDDGPRPGGTGQTGARPGAGAWAVGKGYDHGRMPRHPLRQSGAILERAGGHGVTPAARAVAARMRASPFPAWAPCTGNPMA